MANNEYTISKIELPNGDICNLKSTIYFYGTCLTAADTAAKTSTINNFALINGVTVNIKFSYANTTTAPTLNISGTGAKAIYLYNNNLSPWDDGEVVSLTYDSTGNGTWYINNYNKVEVIRV